VSNEALRLAVQAVGPQAESVSHYLKTHPAHGANPGLPTRAAPPTGG
jgi:hypothetical protein